MLKVRRRGSSFTVETGGGRLVRDARRGGLITDFTVYNALEHRPLVPPGGVLADVTASVNGTLVRLSDGQAEMQVAKRLEDYLVLSTRTRLADGRLEIVQDYEVHEEGAVFVHLAISVSSEAALDLADIAIPVRLKVDARKARWGYYTRQPKYTRDYSTIHAFVGFSLIREYLVTRMVPNAIPLNRWMAATERTPETTAAILRQWGRLLGQFHNHGYTHRDLKDENLLVTEGPEGPRLIPVDLDGVTLSRAARVVRLRRDFWPLLRSLLFLRCYHPDAVQRMIEGYNDVAEQPITAADLPRVLWPDPPSEEGWSGVRLLIMRSGFHREVLHIRVRNRPSVPWADLFLFWVHRLPTLRPMRHSSRVQTAVGSWPELGIECLFKRYPAPRGWLQWRQTLGAPSPARRSLATLTRLRALGLKVPDVLAYLECWAGLRPMGSALITRTVSGMPLDQWLQQSLPADQRAAVAEALVRDLATIHRAGFLVSDLRLSHWQVILDGMTHRLEVVWVEADNLVRFGSDREALNQLADLAVQAAQGLTPGEGRRLWRSYEKARAWTGPYAQGRRRWLFAALRRLRVMPPAA